MTGLPHLSEGQLEALEYRHRVMADALGELDVDASDIHYGRLFDAIDAVGNELWALHLVVRDLRQAAEAAGSAAPPSPPPR